MKTLGIRLPTVCAPKRIPALTGPALPGPYPNEWHPMSDQSPSRDKGHYLALVLAFILVMVGLINTMPEIPGLQDLARDLTGRPFFRVSGFLRSSSTRLFFL